MNMDDANTLAASRSSAEGGQTGQERVEPDGENERGNRERDVEGNATLYSGTRRLDDRVLDDRSRSFVVYR